MTAKLVPISHYITIYFPRGMYKKMLELEKPINKMYNIQGVKATAYCDERIGIMGVSGESKEAVIRSYLFIYRELYSKL